MEASVAQGRLHAEGIQAELIDETIADTFAQGIPAVQAALWVRAEDADRAQRVLSEPDEGAENALVEAGAYGPGGTPLPSDELDPEYVAEPSTWLGRHRLLRAAIVGLFLLAALLWRLLT
jgi:hypothetical protein